MKCLHICNDFLGSKVHENLYKNLDELNVEQTIFHPLRKHNIGQQIKNKKDFNCRIIYSKPLKQYHRIFFRTKIKHLYGNLKANITSNNFDIVHATTLFSDGAIALKYKKEFKTPYIVTVRSTDIDGFLKYRPDLLFLAVKILKESSKIIFISKVLKDKFLNHPLIKKNKSKLEQKCQIIYNGVDSYWINNQSPMQQNITPTKILFVGSLIKRKNVDKLINSVLFLNKSGIQCELTIVGKGGALQKKVEHQAEVNHPCIKYKGAINDNLNLKKLYNSHHIFALPSHGETFGLVYLEALSQGLPILYTKNEGIDGLFNFNIGEKCDTLESASIASNLEKLMTNYSEYEINKIDFSSFSWKNIAKTYLDMYDAISNSN